MERTLNAASELCVSYVFGMPSWPKQAGRADLEPVGAVRVRGGPLSVFQLQPGWTDTATTTTTTTTDHLVARVSNVCCTYYRPDKC